jgi:hypothetical protein
LRFRAGSRLLIRVDARRRRGIQLSAANPRRPAIEHGQIAVVGEEIEPVSLEEWRHDPLRDLGGIGTVLVEEGLTGGDAFGRDVAVAVLALTVPKDWAIRDRIPPGSATATRTGAPAARRSCKSVSPSASTACLLET